MNIQAKIWLSISALVLGYLVTVAINSVIGLYGEQRLEVTAHALFPGTTLCRTADVAWRAQVQSYEGAVLTGDKELIAIAAGHAETVQQSFTDFILLGEQGQRRAIVVGLQSAHMAYTTQAVITYSELATGKVSDSLTQAAAELNEQSIALSERFGHMVTESTAALTQELAETVSRSKNQRYASLFVLIIAGTVSTILVYLMISRWTWRLNVLMQSSESLGRGDFSAHVSTTGQDEIGRLSSSFATMQEAIRARNDELKHLNEGLEVTVRQRTLDLSTRNVQLVHEIEERERAEAEVQDLNNQLLDASHRAGMAEVANGVLHNVGNVLNSVNVSANLISERLRDGKMNNLGKAVSLLIEHQDDLPQFIQSDSKGKQLPVYLQKLSDYLLAQQQVMSDEMKNLCMHMDHIKEIVQLQQSYGKAVGVIQSIRPQDIIDEALRLNGVALQRHEISVIKDVEDLPAAPLDRHKILQILVNLITNAKQALDVGKTNKRLITIAVSRTNNKRLVFSVTDNGIGIDEVTMAKIFTHGFTTRKDGHGFGLHSCANAAKEMGGTMTVCSPGIGLGATFTLNLPIANSG